jgi:hypothetical protein
MAKENPNDEEAPNEMTSVEGWRTAGQDARLTGRRDACRYELIRRVRASLFDLLLCPRDFVSAGRLLLRYSATIFVVRDCCARLRAFSSRIFLRSRRLFGVASTYSSGPMYSRARSSESLRGALS